MPITARKIHGAPSIAEEKIAESDKPKEAKSGYTLLNAILALMIAAASASYILTNTFTFGYNPRSAVKIMPVSHCFIHVDIDWFMTWLF